MKFLTAAADVDAAIQSLGARRKMFSEFREIDAAIKPQVNEFTSPTDRERS